MKNLVFTGLLVLVLVSCKTTTPTVADSSEKSAQKEVPDTLRIANDEYEYEVIIYEVGFNSWLASRARPRGYYSEFYLENKNQYYVTEWNSRVLQPQRYSPSLYEMQIDYSPGIHYGYEVNYLLYNYFVFFQEKYKQNLNPGGITPRP